MYKIDYIVKNVLNYSSNHILLLYLALSNECMIASFLLNLTTSCIYSVVMSVIHLPFLLMQHI